MPSLQSLPRQELSCTLSFLESLDSVRVVLWKQDGLKNLTELASWMAVSASCDRARAYEDEDWETLYVTCRRLSRRRTGLDDTAVWLVFGVGMPGKPLDDEKVAWAEESLRALSSRRVMEVCHRLGRLGKWCVGHDIMEKIVSRALGAGSRDDDGEKRRRAHVLVEATNFNVDRELEEGDGDGQHVASALELGRTALRCLDEVFESVDECGEECGEKPVLETTLDEQLVDCMDAVGRAAALAAAGAIPRCRARKVARRCGKASPSEALFREAQEYFGTAIHYAKVIDDRERRAISRQGRGEAYYLQAALCLGKNLEAETFANVELLCRLSLKETLGALGTFENIGLGKTQRAVAMIRHVSLVSGMLAQLFGDQQAARRHKRYMKRANELVAEIEINSSSRDTAANFFDEVSADNL